MNTTQSSYVQMVLDDAIDHAIGLYHGLITPTDRTSFKTLLIDMVGKHINPEMTDKDIGYSMFDTLLELSVSRNNEYIDNSEQMSILEIAYNMGGSKKAAELIYFDMMSDLEDFDQAFFDTLEQIGDSK